MYSQWSTEACDGSIPSHLAAQEVSIHGYKPSWIEPLPTTDIDRVYWPDTVIDAKRKEHDSHLCGVHLPGTPTAGFDPGSLIVEASSIEKVNLSSTTDAHYDKVDDSAVESAPLKPCNAPNSLLRLPWSSFDALSAGAKKMVCTCKYNCCALCHSLPLQYLFYSTLLDHPLQYAQ